jgi:hypothetical protein
MCCFMDAEWTLCLCDRDGFGADRFRECPHLKNRDMGRPQFLWWRSSGDPVFGRVAVPSARPGRRAEAGLCLEATAKWLGDGGGGEADFSAALLTNRVSSFGRNDGFVV